jgi:hypothetical protein
MSQDSLPVETEKGMENRNLDASDNSTGQLLMARAIAADPDFSSEQVDSLVAMMNRIATLVPVIRGK